MRSVSFFGHSLPLFFVGFALLLGSSVRVTAQAERETVWVVNGHKIPIVIRGNDTIIMGSLREVPIEATRLFKNDKDRYRYIQMRYNANKVKPYAVEFLRMYEDIRTETADMKAGKRRARVHDVQKELQDKFEKPLKNLYRSQGFLLIEIIERETGRSLRDIISEYKGGITATYWSTLGMFYDYHLGQAYDPNADPVLESILRDLNMRQAIDEARLNNTRFDPIQK